MSISRKPIRQDNIVYFGLDKKEYNKIEEI